MGFFSSLLSGIGKIFTGGDLGKAVLGGLSSKYDAKAEAKKTKEQVEAEGKEKRKSVEFEMSLADYYAMKARKEKKDAFSNYTQFGNLASFAPYYRDTGKANIVVPTKPKV